jgi:hypothetical protein
MENRIEWNTYILNNTKFDNLVKAGTKFPGLKEVFERKRMVNNATVRRMVEKRSFKSSTTFSFHKLKSPFLAAKAGNKISSKAIHGK